MNTMSERQGRGYWPPPAPDRRMTTEEVLRSFPSYRGAEEVVAALREGGISPDKVRVVARDLVLVEPTSGSRTFERIVVDGAWSGAVVGALIGLFFGMFGWFAAIQPLVVLVFWGAIFGIALGALVAGVAAGAGSDESEPGPSGSLDAGCYDVMVDQDAAPEARRVYLGTDS